MNKFATIACALFLTAAAAHSATEPAQIQTEPAQTQVQIDTTNVPKCPKTPGIVGNDIVFAKYGYGDVKGATCEYDVAQTLRDMLDEDKKVTFTGGPFEMNNLLKLDPTPGIVKRLVMGIRIKRPGKSPRRVMVILPENMVGSCTIGGDPEPRTDTEHEREPRPHRRYR